MQRLSRQAYDDEDLSLLVAKTLSGNQRPRKQKDMSEDSLEELEERQQTHNVIVIDEVDQFNSSEKAFTILVQTILKNAQFPKTNTSIIGIANQVDLPFKKKHSAIAMRDC